MGSNPSTESNYKSAVSSKNKMQMLCMRCWTTTQRLQPERKSKHSSTESATNGGHWIRQSGPRPDSRLLRQTALEVLTRSARSDSPRKTRPERIPAKLRRRRRRTAAAAAAAWEEKREGGYALGLGLELCHKCFGLVS
ncbi:hypothetical protein F511_25308 [Dorcoceras hygrometricum]|uniref:Uncharacterized protein n=1 Tax=Dorcoceras hygrometricum TaxID=472368 RepID=A0A2Z7AF61_9LAMI|nr:hypothetical protein F511_25308 [Dorcoceras hygrometricum]